MKQLSREIVILTNNPAMRNATYHRIPCFYNPINDELKGKNKFFDVFVSLFIWIDFNVRMLDELPIWVEVDKLEMN